MSKGLGELQNDILLALSDKSTPILEFELLWQIVEEKKKINKIPISDHFNNGTIEEAFYKSFRRSLNGLKEKGRVKVLNPSKFNSLDELIRLYPYCTRNNLIKEMRTMFLPFMKEYINDHLYRLKFKKHEVEAHHFRTYSKNNPESFTLSKIKWLELRKKIIKLFEIQGDNNFDTIIKFLAKGEQYFTNNKITVAEQMSVLANELLELVITSNENQLEFTNELIAFLTEIIYGNVYSHDQLKNQLYIVAVFYKRNTSSLVAEFKEVLFRQFSEQIGSLPNSKSDLPKIKEREGIVEWYPVIEDDKIDPIIDKLILKDVFSSFRYIEQNI
jgi:hypothetical protein